MSTALNRLQNTLLEEEEVVADTRKRNTILTLVAWLKRILASPTSADSNTTLAEAQLLSLTELLPTELLLTKLMPQLNDNGNSQTDSNESAQSDRSHASSKRFARQSNKRFNTVGVSKEELADARLYLQKKLLSDSLASTKTSTEQQNILDDSDDSRRKSLNLSQLTNDLDLDSDIESILNKTKKSFSKSIEIVPNEDNLPFKNVLPAKAVNQPKREQHVTANEPKVVLRRKSNPGNHNQASNRIYADADQNPTTDTDDDQDQYHRRNNPQSNPATATKSMNKFALRKMKMKRANTIDIPKNNPDELVNSDQALSDSNSKNVSYNASTNDVRRQIQEKVKTDLDKDHLPELQVKSARDQRFLAFLNRKPDENRMSWMNPHKSMTTSSDQKNASRSNWTSKFGNIKNSFERTDSTTSSTASPRLSKTNHFTHAPTSPFKPVQTRPPQIPNGYHHHHSHQQVLQKVAAIHNSESTQQHSESIARPQLRTYKSLPAYSDQPVKSYQNPSPRNKPHTWQPGKYASVDSYVANQPSNNAVSSSYNPLYVPLQNNDLMQPIQQLPLQQQPTYSPPQQYPIQQPPIQQPAMQQPLLQQPPMQQSPIQQPPMQQTLLQQPPMQQQPFNQPIQQQFIPQQPLISNSEHNSPSNAYQNNQPQHIKTPLSPVSNEFPSYTFTSTDYTQPNSVSTFDLEREKPPTIKNTILPDDSYLKSSTASSTPTMKNTILPDDSYLKKTSPSSSTPKQMPPLLGSSRLNKQMKTMDVYSSSEYLSEPSSCYRSPQPFSPYDYGYTSGNESHRDSNEFTAKSHIMTYPKKQTATYVNNTQHYDREQEEKHAKNLHTFLTNNVRQNQKSADPYLEKNASISPFSETNFSHVNQTYVPPVSAPLPTTRQNNNFTSMENVSTTPVGQTELAEPIRLRNDTSHYSSHAALFNQKELTKESSTKSTPYLPQGDKIIEHSALKATPAAKVNCYGSQYMPPKIESIFENPNANKFSRKPVKKWSEVQSNAPNQSNVIQNNISQLNRSQTITHKRIDNYEIKRKQSLPAQKSDYFDPVMNKNEMDEWGNDASTAHKYLPSGVLKKSKSTHTLALLQQFEDKGKVTNESTTSNVPKVLPSYVAQPTIRSKPSAPRIDPKPKPQEIRPKPQEIKPKLEETQPKVQEIKPTPSDVKPFKQPEQPKPVQIKPKPILQQEPPKESAKPVKPVKPMARAPSPAKPQPSKLEAPEITETPSSPLVEDGHIIYPGQTSATKNRVLQYAQTLNAQINRKSIVCDDEDEEDDNSTSTPTKGILRKSKSGTLLTIPKQYESAIKKSEVLEKERTVAAYFTGSKSPQGLQRSSSQHSVLSSSSFKSTGKQEQSSNENVEQSGQVTENSISSTMTTTTSTTTKSAHHLKILRKQQQKQSSSNTLAKSQTMPSLNLLDESNVDDAFDDLFATAFNK